VSSIRRGALHGCSDRWRRSTAPGSATKPSRRSNAMSRPASAPPASSWPSTNPARAPAAGTRRVRSAARSRAAGPARSPTRPIVMAPATSSVEAMDGSPPA
jgi:hypothetical protein